MEILSSSTFEVVSDLGGFLTCVSVVSLIIGLIVWFHGFMEDESILFWVGIGMFVVGLLGIFAFHDLNATKYVEHKVVVEDFNVIHEQGYEITEQEGDIYTIQKKAGVE
jgi:xanthine/uracil permease